MCAAVGRRVSGLYSPGHGARECADLEVLELESGLLRGQAEYLQGADDHVEDIDLLLEHRLHRVGKYRVNFVQREWQRAGA